MTPAEELHDAAQILANSIHERVAMPTELLAELLEGMAAHWETRPIGDLDIYLATPLCKLARHILGRTS